VVENFQLISTLLGWARNGYQGFFLYRQKGKQLAGLAEIPAAYKQGFRFFYSRL
jgi:hypothetical protein